MPRYGCQLERYPALDPDHLLRRYNWDDARHNGCSRGLATRMARSRSQEIARGFRFLVLDGRARRGTIEGMRSTNHSLHHPTVLRPPGPPVQCLVDSGTHQVCPAAGVLAGVGILQRPCKVLSSKGLSTF